MNQKKDPLTIEDLAKEFPDNFQMTVHAIRSAQHDIRAGHATHVTDVLKDLRRNPHLTIEEKEEFDRE